ncbi:MAG: DsbA family protein [Lachnospiraceae bacterium]|nr:DsbA family protein [Lachnospiraceae bacterium]
MEQKIILTAFTDPMMGLSYESEPIMGRLKQKYGARIEFRYVMSLLVRDVSDFMTPEERLMDAESGILRYCNRLAGIYKSEEAIGGLPINMDGFRLFDTEHRSSKPLNLAYKAAQLTDPEKADVFLTKLRHATVIDCLPTTHFDEILKVVRKVEIDEISFKRHYQDGSAEKALEKDLEYTHRLGIHSLPAYLIQHGEKALIMQSFEYQDFTEAIKKVCNNLS